MSNVAHWNRVMLAAAAAVLGGAAATTRAAFVSGLVNVDFDTAASAPGGGTPNVTTGAAVVGSAADAWNSVATNTATTGSGVVLRLADGTTDSTARLAYTASSAFYRNATTSPNKGLLADYLTSNSGVTSNVTLTGLNPGTTYQLLLYAGVDANFGVGVARRTEFTVTGDGAAQTAAVTVQGQTVAGANDSAGQLAGYVAGSNYVGFTTTPDATGQLAIAVRGFTAGAASEGDLSGLQIAPVPEPTTAGLAAAAVAGLLARRRRRRAR